MGMRHQERVDRFLEEILETARVQDGWEKKKETRLILLTLLMFLNVLVAFHLNCSEIRPP